MNEPSAPVPPPVSEPQPVVRRYRWGRLGTLAALITIIACIAVVLGDHKSALLEKPEGTRPNRMLEMGARYAVGVHHLMQMTGQDTSALTAPMTEDLNRMSHSPADLLRITILKSWMLNTWPSEAAWTEKAGDDAELQKDADTLTQLQTTKGNGEKEPYLRLHQRHGWMAELALAQATPADSPERKVIVDSAIKTALALVGGSLLGMAAAACGLVILILGFLRWRRGHLQFTLQRIDPADGGVLMEGFAFYMALFLLLPGAILSLPFALPREVAYLGAGIAVIVGLLWPLWRGMGKPVWLEAMGLHRGEGLRREMGAGILGWLAALPILVLGMIAASLITKATGVPPSHPIMEVFAGNGWARLGAVILAAVWAPVSEELMFRGMLFPGLSSRLRWVVGTLLGAFIFAVIHPQGWAGVPAIMTLAIAFSTLRLWRRSLIAPMTAHALNNGSISLLMLLM
jgi:membrane protease YdiL (CAAX protease family)